MTDEPHHIITSPDGRAQQRRLLTEDELRLTITTAVLMGIGLTGMLRRDRDQMRKRIADDILGAFARSNYRVFGVIGEHGPIGFAGGKAMPDDGLKKP